jgi:hypothetical protein
MCGKNRNHIIRDPFAQMLWVSYFSGAPCALLKDVVAAIQNELRNLGFRYSEGKRVNIYYAS